MRIKFEAFLSNIASLGLAMKSCVKKLREVDRREERRGKRKGGKTREDIRGGDSCL